MGVTVRPAGRADLRAAAGLVRGQPLFAPYGLTPAGLERALAGALGRGEEVHVADSGGRLSGLVWFQLRGAFGRSGYLRLLVTDGAAQGQGIGSRLLGHAEELVFRQADDMFLLVNSENSGARRFYERHGWRVAGRLDAYVAPGLDEVLLRRTNPDKRRS